MKSHLSSILARFLFGSLTLIVTLFLSLYETGAAVITWETPQVISGDSDVNTQGDLVLAYNLGAEAAGSPTINGVSFTLASIGGKGAKWVGSDSSSEGALLIDDGVGELDWGVSSATVNASSSAPYIDLSAGYKQLIGSSVSTQDNEFSGTLTYTISNLNIDQEYLVQFWINESRSFAYDLAIENTLSGAQLDWNNSGEGGLGSYVIGTFVADTTAQVITVTTSASNGDRRFQLNGYQLRAIPEPSAVLLFLSSIAIVVWIGFRRRGVQSKGTVSHTPNTLPNTSINGDLRTCVFRGVRIFILLVVGTMIGLTGVHAEPWLLLTFDEITANNAQNSETYTGTDKEILPPNLNHLIMCDDSGNAPKFIKSDGPQGGGAMKLESSENVGSVGLMFDSEEGEGKVTVSEEGVTFEVLCRAEDRPDAPIFQGLISEFGFGGLGPCLRLYGTEAKVLQFGLTTIPAKNSTENEGNHFVISTEIDSDFYGKWHHIAAVLRPDVRENTNVSAELFLDGEMVASEAIFIDPADTNKKFLLGGISIGNDAPKAVLSTSSPGRIFCGEMDAVAISLEALNPKDFVLPRS